MKPPNEEHTVSESTNHVYPKAAAGEQSANVAPNPSFPKLEESVLDYWDKDGTSRSPSNAVLPAITARTNSSSSTVRRSPTACRTMATC